MTSTSPLGDKLVSIRDGRPFVFNAYPNQSDNQRRYHDIGKLVEKYIYELLVDVCHLQPCLIPVSEEFISMSKTHVTVSKVDRAENEPKGFIFASEGFQAAPYLMILIHGNGSVRAGQWSRKSRFASVLLLFLSISW